MSETTVIFGGDIGDRPPRRRTLTTFQALRILGPCSIVKLAKFLDNDPKAVHSVAYNLVQAGLAVHDGPNGWDVSDAGRALLQAREGAARAKIEARTNPPMPLFGEAP